MFPHGFKKAKNPRFSRTLCIKTQMEDEADIFGLLGNDIIEDEEEIEQNEAHSFKKDKNKSRESCSNCERPSSVCWCPYLPQPKIGW